MRELLGYLASKLSKTEGDLRGEVAEFIKARRRNLMFLKDACNVGQYSYHDLDEAHASVVLRAAKDTVGSGGSSQERPPRP